ncbi:uncharacterized protein [Dysidea avara]|uniref:uncharacterized protein n=1 Tax=Dysidea avara TaxID=196820 RepID=UPI003329F7E6
MSELQRLQAKRRGIKASVTKLITKVEDMISADLEGVSTQYVSESRKLLAETTLVQLKHKKGQIMELDDAIGAKIEAEQEFEEEITNADTYQITLDENIAFLSEFIRKAGLPPPELQRPPPSVTPQISPVSTQPPPETSNQTVSASSNVATADSHAFRRFVSRRSLPRLMLSDNASTYQAAAEELQKLFTSAELAEDLARRGVKWYFIPKRAPWFGGFWERLIGLTKSSLKKVLGRTHATLESLQTIIVEVEAVLNNRPLTYVSPDVEDMEPITPSHLLHGRPIVSLPHYDVQDDELTDPTYGETVDINRSAKVHAQLLAHFWNRWKLEYLTALREFHKATGCNTQAVKAGDIVLIHDDTPRVQWKLAVIEQVNKGADGLIRSANVRTSTGRTNRSIARLYPLEVTATETSTTTKISGLCDNLREQSAMPAPQPQGRPVRQAALQGRQKVQQWTHSLLAPPEDVKY